MATQKPNIILVNCDDLGYGDLGCYGSSLNRSPAIDKLAAGGLRLTDFYMASPVCSPSRAAMMTGCYPPRIGFDNFEGKGVLFPGQGVGLSQREETIAGLLKKAGYATCMIGKWHCGDQPEFLPTRHGFDSWYGLPYSNDMGRQIGDSPWRALCPPLPLMDGEEIIQQQPDLASLTERYVERAVRFLRQQKDEPFFLYLAHMHVHRPIYVNGRFLEQSQNGRYGAAVASIDWSVEVLLHELEALGQRENTLFIFTSDNGSRGIAEEGCSNGPLRGAKGQTWEGGLRVPCILNWPGKIAPGQVKNDLVASIDFLPTFAALAGVQPQRENPIDGMDVTAFLLEGQPSPRSEFVYYRKSTLEAIRRGRYKLHLYKEEQPVRLLYDLDADPGETADIADSHPDIVEALQALAARYAEELGNEPEGITGRSQRPIGRVENPKPLTEYDPSHPYVEAMYDCGDCG